MFAVKARWHWFVGGSFILLFLVLLALRLSIVQPPPLAGQKDSTSQSQPPTASESWMNITQNGRKIGYTYRLFSPITKGYRLEETVFMRINTMGIVQGISLKTEGDLHPDMTLASFHFDLQSNLFRFTARGVVDGKKVTLYSGIPGAEKKTEMTLKEVPHLASGILDTVSQMPLNQGESRVFHVFDPAMMGQRPVTVTAMPDEIVTIMGRRYLARKIAVDFMGAKQFAWIGKDGEVLKEKGILGMALERVTKQEALEGLASAAGTDLTEAASVSSNVKIENPAALSHLKMRLNQVQDQILPLSGGRQTFHNGILTVEKENMVPASLTRENLSEGTRKFLLPSALIQSDHPRILSKVEEILQPDDSADVKARKLVTWVYRHVEKRPVLSVPNALEVLDNLVGDCNEHAVLLAALARAAGIPAQIEAGLVYQRGRFYYHAWNVLFVGQWVTADAVMNQMPADVTHLRFVRGEADQQLDLMGLMGNVRIEILDVSK